MGGKAWEFLACALALGESPADKWAILWRLSKNVRARLGMASYDPTRVFELRTRYGPVTLRDNIGDVTNLPDLFHRNVYRVRAIAEPGVIIDVGANIGLFAAWAARHNPDKKIICFEPLASNTSMIQRNCPGAVVNQLGLGKVRTRVRLGVDGQSTMASAVETPWETTGEEFDVVPLDDYVREKGIDRVAFLKIDTEGMEVDVLAGSPDTLRATQRVAMETHGRELHDEAIGLLRGAGLTIDAEALEGRTGFVFASREG